MEAIEMKIINALSQEDESGLIANLICEGISDSLIYGIPDRPNVNVPSWVEEYTRYHSTEWPPTICLTQEQIQFVRETSTSLSTIEDTQAPTVFELDDYEVVATDHRMTVLFSKPLRLRIAEVPRLIPTVEIDDLEFKD